MSILYPFTGKYRITSDYGTRTAPTDGGSTNHKGIDFSMPIGTNILSSIAGRVAEVGYNSSRGNYVVVDNDGGISSLYQHLDTILVKQGDTVRQGQTIAKSGNTGTSTGPHLHFELKINGQNVNPALYLQTYEQNNGGDTAAGAGFNIPAADTVIEAIKKYWYYIAGGLVVFALFDKFKN